MIHVNYTLTKKDYKKYYIQAMTINYMKIYVVVLGIAIVLTKVLGLLFKSDSLQSTSLSLLTTLIPTLFLCLGLSILISYFEIRKVGKEYPETMEGNFKLRFEKKFIIWQINGENKKYAYDSFTLRKGLKSSVVLTSLNNHHIIIPENLLTKEQTKTIKANIRG